jgi:hypothetical protein
MEQHEFGSFTSPPVARRGDGQATTGQIAEWCRPEIVYAGGKPTAIQIAKHARAPRSIGVDRTIAPGLDRPVDLLV